MRQVPDYNLLDESTWTIIPESEVWGQTDRENFQRELIRIAGLNPFGQSNLRIVWGVTHMDEMLLDDKPKYWVSSNNPVVVALQYRDKKGQVITVKQEEDVPRKTLFWPVYNNVHLGERRFMVEVWRSPEFLKASGRYQTTFDVGEQRTYFECRNCRSTVPSAPHTLQADVERICLACGSKRVSPVDIREDVVERLFADFPEQGCYDLFLRLERKDGTYHAPDGEALAGIAWKWERDNRTFKQKDAEIKQGREREAKASTLRRRTIWHPDNVSKPLREEEMTI